MPPTRIDLDRYRRIVSRTDSMRLNGKVAQVIGVVVESHGPPAHIGEICTIHVHHNEPPVPAEVVGFRDDRVLLMPLGEIHDISQGNEVRATGSSLTVKVGDALLGRVLDGLGNPIDGLGPIYLDDEAPVNRQPPNPMTRARITEPLAFGVRAIDGLLTCGKGQRVGIFAGSGVGKSTLLGMIARNTEADINVIALIGERGREVKDFIERDLGEEGLRRSVVVVATSDQPAICRLKGAVVATTIAEHFRDQGLNVMLMMDSVTRFAWAQREIGLAVGEPPTTRGYTPSVFATLPRLLERSGTAEKGSITGIYTVLVDGDDMNEPIADAVRSILDGHIVLSRDLVAKNHYPAIDVNASISRLMSEVASPEHKAAAGVMRETLSTFKQAEDLINIGAYSPGSNPKIDQARAMIDEVNGFLRQRVEDPAPFDESVARMSAIVSPP
ncbi:MAG TPA: flagellar protein export ATPase FliI [Armatimonadota bacterium]|jgi:flagellum-specific ATP synthase